MIRSANVAALNRFGHFNMRYSDMCESCWSSVWLSFHCGSSTWRSEVFGDCAISSVFDGVR